MSGRVVHFEIPFDDGERASAFYEKAFAWQLTPLPDMGYTLVATGPSGDAGPTEPGFINGGIAQRQEQFAAPTVVIEVDDIETALETINAAGGTTISGREAVGDLGFSATFRDPEGNVLGIWESAAD